MAKYRKALRRLDSCWTSLALRLQDVLNKSLVKFPSNVSLFGFFVILAADHGDRVSISNED